MTIWNGALVGTGPSQPDSPSPALSRPSAAREPTCWSTQHGCEAVDCGQMGWSSSGTAFWQLEPQARVPCSQDLLLGTYPRGLRGDTRKSLPPKESPWSDRGALCVDPSDVMQCFPNDLPRTARSRAIKMLHEKSLSAAQKAWESKG